MNQPDSYTAERLKDIQAQGEDPALKGLANALIRMSQPYKYVYNYTWLGRPIIQLPQDIVALQELIWRIKPRVVVETGIAHGGSLIMSASILELIGGDGMVIGIDIDIRAHNRVAIEQHPMMKRIKLIQGSSIAPEVISQVNAIVDGRQPVLVILDSNHAHKHVLEELRLYSPLVKKGSYLIVMDTAIEDVPSEFFPDRPWGKGNNPKTAVHEFLRSNSRFRIDKSIQDKLLMTAAPDGYLECVGD